MVADTVYRAASWLCGTAGVSQVDFSRLRGMAKAGERIQNVAAQVFAVDTSTMPGVVGDIYPESGGAAVDTGIIIAMMGAAEDWELPEKTTDPRHSERDFLRPWDATPDADFGLFGCTARRWAEDCDAIGQVAVRRRHTCRGRGRTRRTSARSHGIGGTVALARCLIRGRTASLVPSFLFADTRA